MQRTINWVSSFWGPSPEQVLAEKKRKEAIAEQKVIEATQSAVFLAQCALAGTTVVFFFTNQSTIYTLGAAALTLYAEILAKGICEKANYPKAAEHIAEKYSVITRSFMMFKSVAYPIIMDGIIKPNMAKIAEGVTASSQPN